MAFRKGQWVKLARAIAFGSVEEPAGTVGIHRGPVHVRHQDGSVTQDTEFCEVHLVHVAGGVTQEMRTVDGVASLVDVPYRGGETRKVVAVKEADLVAVTTREDIPVDRLATYAPEWVPQP